MLACLLLFLWYQVSAVSIEELKPLTFQSLGE